MRVSVTARHFDLNDDIKGHTEERIERFHRLADGLLHATAVL